MDGRRLAPAAQGRASLGGTGAEVTEGPGPGGPGRGWARSSREQQRSQWETMKGVGQSLMF